MTEFSVWVLFFVVFNVLNFPKDISTLKLLRINVPKLVVKGEITTLRCEYELEGDRLYSVLWYKDHEEFYRFVPRNEPKQHSYKLDGFRVEVSTAVWFPLLRCQPLRKPLPFNPEGRHPPQGVFGGALAAAQSKTDFRFQTHKSNDQQVLLRNVNLKASGVYRCEVSAEAPSFTSVHGEGRMEVIAPPKEDPEIVGDRKIYQIGEILSLNCTSGKSYPSASLKWFINDIQINPDYEAVFQHHGLLTTIIGLNLEIQTQHFVEKRMVVRCVSSVYSSKSSFFEGNVAPPIDRREALFLVEGGGNTARISKCIMTMAVVIFLT